MSTRVLASAAGLLLAGWLAGVSQGAEPPRSVPAPDARRDAFVPDQVIVRYRETPSSVELNRLKRALPGTRRWHRMRHRPMAKGAGRRPHPLASVRVVTLRPGQDVQRAAQRISRLPGVAYAHPNYVMHACFSPDDPFFFTQQYGPQIIGAEQAWDRTLGSPDVVIAIADSGLRFDHEEFAGATWINPADAIDGADNDDNGFIDDHQGWDFINNDNDPSDDFGHGTHVAGIAAARVNNGVGIAGMSNSTVMVLKVFDDRGDGTWEAIADAIAYAVDNGARVVNYSGGGVGGAGVLADMVAYAHDHDVPVVAAAGNGASDVPFFPAAYPQAIAVTATNANDGIWPSSNFGTYVDVGAPGDAIFSTWFRNSGDYRSQNGTSMATPHVTGLIALMYSVNRNLHVEEIRTLLRDNAVDLGDPGFDERFGWGRIDAAATLQAVPTIDFAFPDGVPDVLPPDQASGIRVDIVANAEPLDPDSPAFHYRIDGGPYSVVPLQDLGGGAFEAPVPPFECGGRVEFFFDAATTSGSVVVTSPRDAPEQVYAADVGTFEVFFDDDFEQDRGWQTSFGGGSQTSGQWVRVDPIGTGRQPEDDYSEDGTQCFVTGNCEGGDGACDVDGGPVVLTSPRFPLSGASATISYARWFNNSNGGDSLLVDVSNDDGQSWVPLEVVGPGGDGGWQVARFSVADVIGLTDQMRVRFTTQDEPPISVTEAAVDEFLATGVVCGADVVPPQIVHDDGSSTSPFSGYVDPRAESSDGLALDEGIDQLVITFSEPVRDVGAAASSGVTRDAFSITGTASSYPQIVSIETLSDRSLRLALSGPLPVGEWTTVIADVEDFSGNRIEHGGDQGPGLDEPDRIDIGFLPGDVDQNGVVRPIDLLRFRQIMQGTLHYPAGQDSDYVDIDRNGLLQPLDLLRFRQLFLGTGHATRPWAGQSLPERP